MMGRSVMQIGAAVNKRDREASARQVTRGYQLRAAIHYLGAVRHSLAFWRYHAAETRRDYLVTAREMRQLGEMIAAAESRATAYSEWCSLTKSRPVEAR
jgi:hypothetical protein